MKQFFFLLLVFQLFLTVTVARSSQKPAEQSKPQSQQKQPAPQKTENTTHPAIQIQKQFQPTEHIKADTVIAFPADI